MTGRVAAGSYGILLALGLAWPLIGNNYHSNVGLTLLAWVALGESWIVLSGMTGYVSLGHAAFFGLGAYVMAMTWGSIPLWVGMLMSGVAGGLLAALVGYPCLRVRGPYFVILTLAVAEFVKFVVIYVESSLDKFGRLLVGAPDIRNLYYVVLSIAAVTFIVASVVRRSRFGAGLRAIREDEEAAETIGIPVIRYKFAAFVLSAIMPGVVGATLVMHSGYFEPQHVFSPLMSLTIIAIAIIGGSDDAVGPLLGASFLVILSELLWAKLPELYMIVVGVMLITFVMVAPEGIHGSLRMAIRNLTPTWRLAKWYGYRDSASR